MKTVIRGEGITYSGNSNNHADQLSLSELAEKEKLNFSNKEKSPLNETQDNESFYSLLEKGQKSRDSEFKNELEKGISYIKDEEFNHFMNEFDKTYFIPENEEEAKSLKNNREKAGLSPLEIEFNDGSKYDIGGTVDYGLEVNGNSPFKKTLSRKMRNYASAVAFLSMSLMPTNQQSNSFNPSNITVDSGSKYSGVILPNEEGKYCSIKTSSRPVSLERIITIKGKNGKEMDLPGEVLSLVGRPDNFVRERYVVNEEAKNPSLKESDGILANITVQGPGCSLNQNNKTVEVKGPSGKVESVIFIDKDGHVKVSK